MTTPISMATPKSKVIQIPLTILMALALLVSGCTGKEAGASIEAPQKSVAGQVNQAEPVVCVMLIDGTGSYEYLEKAKQTAASVVRMVPGGSKIYVRWITENSILDRSAIVSALLPTEPAELKNPFTNPQVKFRYKSVLKKNRAIREQIISQITKAKSPKAMRTDIWGGLLAASERFKTNPNMKPMLIIHSDMIDNVDNRYSTIDLTNVTVRILDFQTDTKSEVTKQQWTQHFSSLGAKTVEFYYLDDVLRFSREN